MHRPLGLVLAALLHAAGTLLAGSGIIDRQIVRQPVEQGVELIAIRQFDADGWLNVFALEVDHPQEHLSFDALLGNEALTSPERLTSMARRRGAVAGINGDFFYIRTSNAPLGVHLQGGELFKSPASGRELAAGMIHADGRRAPFLGHVRFHGAIAVSGSEIRKLAGWNEPAVPENGIVLYNERWGQRAPGPDSPDMSGWPGLVHVVLDGTQTVTEVLDGAPGPAFPPGGAVLVGRGEGGEWLKEQAGTGVQFQVKHSLSPAGLHSAIGGNPRLLRNGRNMHVPGGDIHPRTAIGFNEARSKIWLAVVDGRSPASRGASMHELAELMKELGATEAVNLDGGGSSTIVARTPGADAPVLQNVPSDGGERRVPNGFGLFSSSAPGPLTKLFIQPPPPVGAYAMETRELRLAPGSVYSPAVAATDDHLNPQEVSPEKLHWRIEPERLGLFDARGKLHVAEAGQGRITVALGKGDGAVNADCPARVIGQPVLLEILPTELAVSPEQEVALVVNAVDARGFRAPLAPDNLRWEIRGDVGRIDGSLFIAAPKPASGAVTVSFGSLSRSAPVGIGERPVQVATFEAAADWSTHAVPEVSSARISAADHLPYIRDREQALRLDYSFTGTTRTRAAYVRPRKGPLELEGRPLKLGAWIFGDGKGAWLRGQVVDSSGIARTVDFAASVDWTGWRYVEAEIPQGTSYPIALRSIYVVETRPDAQYEGTVYFDELLAVRSPELDPAYLEENLPLPDPANRPASIEMSREDDFRFVVFGDARIKADDPDSTEIAVLSALVDQINREEIALSLFTGDLVANDAEENYVVAKRLLDRLHMPYHVAAGDHEIAGSNNYERYQEFFGPTYYDFTHGPAHFISLNTARPAGPRASEVEQWTWLREKLAASDSPNVFLLTHTPPVDPTPGGKTGWSDPAEIELLQRILTGLADTGRTVYSFNGHVPGFHRRIHEGVRYLTSAGAGSTPFVPSDQDGFFHYIVVTVQEDEVTYQVIPLLEKIELPELVSLHVGESHQLEPVGVGPRELSRFPLRYPAAVEWTVANPEVARIDAQSGQVTALNRGETTATICSGRVSASVIVRVGE